MSNSNNKQNVCFCDVVLFDAKYLEKLPRNSCVPNMTSPLSFVNYSNELCHDDRTQ